MKKCKICKGIKSLRNFDVLNFFKNKRDSIGKECLDYYTDKEKREKLKEKKIGLKKSAVIIIKNAINAKRQYVLGKFWVKGLARRSHLPLCPLRFI